MMQSTTVIVARDLLRCREDIQAVRGIQTRRRHSGTMHSRRQWIGRTEPSDEQAFHRMTWMLPRSQSTDVACAPACVFLPEITHETGWRSSS